jgi:hypothetical protein
MTQKYRANAMWAVGFTRAYMGVRMATLVQLYEEHAADCSRAAKLTDDADRRSLYLKLAEQ